MRIDPGMRVVRYSHSPRVMTILKPSPLSSFAFNSSVSMRSISCIRRTPLKQRSYNQVSPIHGSRGLGATSSARCSFGLTGIASGEADRQHHPEAGLAGFGSDLNLPPVLVDDDVVGDVQAQARADARSFCGKEGFEDARLDLWGYPRSVVDDVDRNDVVLGVGAQSKFSVAINGVDRVVDEVGPHLIELGSVGLYWRHIVGVIALDAYIRIELWTQEHQGVLQALDHIDALDRRLIQIRIRLDGLDDLRHGFGALSHLLEQAVDRRGGSQPPDYDGQLCGREVFGQLP